MKEKLSIVFAIISVISVIYLYFDIIHKRPYRPLKETEEYYPPDNLPPIVVAGFVGRTHISENYNNQINSLLISLANKGYLRINKLEGSERFSIQKLKDYDGTDKYEKEYFYGLFVYCNSNKLEDLTLPKGNFYRIIDKIHNFLANEDQIGSRIHRFYEENVNKSIILLFLSLFFFIICAATLPVQLNDPSLSTGALFGFTLCFFSLKLCTIGIFSPDSSNSLASLAGLACAMIISVPLFTGFFVSLGFTPWSSILLFNSMIIFLFRSGLRNRTEFGAEFQGKILGFRKFLCWPKKEKLEELLKENPSYLYDMLPYAYALGVSDNWVKKFKLLSVSPPDWYYSKDLDSFADSFKRSMRKIDRGLAERPYERVR